MLLGAAATMQAQDTYLNDQMVNTSGDVYGTARFVGMGGAMGALGADISTISWNPAGIGMLRKSELGFTAGAIWGKQAVQSLTQTHATLDQMGGVFSVKLDGDKMNFVNLGFNYQKKKNFNNAFAADNLNLGGLSQMTEVADLALNGYDTDYNLTGLAVGNQYLTKNGEGKYYNKYSGEANYYTQRTWGSLDGFDFNLSGNVQDRFYWGFTMGFDHMRYRAETDYYEESHATAEPQKRGDYSLYNDKQIDGFGFNMKFGTIIRPIEDNPFRFGITIETPTWYQLKNSTYYQLTDHVDKEKTSMPESYLEYSIRTPWKLRLGVGSTVGTQFAWDVDYEYANYSVTKMGYPNNDIDDPHGSIFSNTWDDAMNQQTKENLKAVHNVRAGFEYKPTKALSVRLGYNFATSAYKDNPSFDQLNLNSFAMDFSTSTSYMKVGALNSLTMGLGYRWKYAYIDMAYKLTNQKADFYSFYEPTDLVFSHSPNALQAVNTDLTRHQITATLGFRF